MKPNRKRKVLIRTAGAAAVLTAAVLAALYFRPDIYLRLLQTTGFVDGELNSREMENENEERTLENGVRFIGNLSYESEYPNGFLDLYLTDQEDSGKAPLFFYIHGGGYAGGDKAAVFQRGQRDHGGSRCDKESVCRFSTCLYY